MRGNLLEEEGVKKICNFLDKINIKYKTEVVPDECLKWEKPYRVDLIIYLDNKTIGVEAKSIHTLRSGSIIAGAIEQIKKYRTLSYDNKKINIWCICLFSDEWDKQKDEFMSNEKRFIEEFLRYFLVYYNIGLLNLIEYKNEEYNRIVVSPYTKRAIHINKNGIKFGDGWNDSN